MCLSILLISRQIGYSIKYINFTICLKAAACICFSVRVWFSKIQGLKFFCLLNFFFQFFMNFLVKIYKKIYDKHNETLWTTDFFNSVFCLVSCSSKNQVPYFKAVTRLLLREKTKQKCLKKPRVGQVFQFVTSFET